MSDYKLILPSMGEGVMEATVTNWIKNIGDAIAEDESVVEIATDKVDSDVPSPVAGVLKEILVPVDGIAKVGEPIAILSVDGVVEQTEEAEEVDTNSDQEIADTAKTIEAEVATIKSETIITSSDDKFYSPLVKSIAKEEGVSQTELDQILGSGKDGRVTKDDILNFVKNRGTQSVNTTVTAPVTQPQAPQIQAAPISVGEGDEIIEMDRMRKIIAQNMLQAKQIAPHVTSFVEVDMTNIVLWRDKNKNEFQKKHGEKITFMPIFIEAVAKAIQDFPMINVSVDGDKIIKKKNINIGMAAALPSGNLIVPVIKNADQFNLAGLASQVNDLANRARTNKLKPVEIQGGTYTITNIGSFGNTLGTPIIPQPQVAILAVGAIVKKPAVIETPQGDMIAIRHKMYLSHAYDHRVVDGALGGMFVKRVAEYLEAFDMNTLV
ncbi:2-oxo acid dehydrogenase subunit E2 [Empedobacter stercoris]|uniref:Dihydrolipoamide acetyltransferase component of pyruvate dehydrogenase complex n=1 Tax=Empedobacter stercoris TaxID=1628248 RepID=A0ABX1WLS8_9FLAO|nr:dihydrolipoamide acetyltransferase family protein [Empedobacter stercoris]HJD87795.1 2-oxo acid dehydrogenase subunit E2 [Empedobacter falsenii]MCA4780882.1 2-oxo acid dehydrogenase subunit E2 [Empedobacter stercoris]MCA4808496.1 2-oxo acid dehydrogenase subunit E2 [Empedobacter stercoris]NOJ75497.1 2-oxo acid dehydrogenase subunit E2 [Empedobacter stercoris]QNT13212.1 2-oxo acid dehydrogenase subunit E2 [Empedobacter stercoris]